LKRDLLRRSSIGAIYTGRSRRETSAGRSDAVGVDGTFTFYTNLAITTYWARTRTDGLDGSDQSYRGQLDYSGDRYSVQLEHLNIGDNFNPELGFIRRDDLRKSFGSFKFSPRPRHVPAVRKFYGLASMNYLETIAGRLDTREGIGEAGIEFQNSDKLSVSYLETYELIPRPFAIAVGVTVPVGGYNYDNLKVAYTLARQHVVAGGVTVERGSFYSGHKTGVSFTRGRVELTPRLSAEPSVSINRVDLLQGSFTNRLVGARVTYTMSPRMFTSALLQYNSGANSMGTNARLRWEYHPGSELFVVYNDQRDARTAGIPDLMNRAFVVKINRLLRF
jgi:hypothetical protein